MAHRNWTEVYNYFISNEGTSYADLSVKFQIPLGTIKDKAAREHWQQKREQIITNAIKRLEEGTIQRIAESKKQQVQFGKFLQAKAAKALSIEKYEPKTASQIAQWIKIGVSIERKALNMDEKTSIKSKQEYSNNIMPIENGRPNDKN